MKIASTIARYLLGLMFVVFGLNGFLNFIHQPPPTGLALQFFMVVSASHYIALVFAIQLIAGLLLLVNRYVPLALTLLGPVLVNILLFHITMNLSGIPMGLIATILWFLVFWSVRPAFDGIFQQRVQN